MPDAASPNPGWIDMHSHLLPGIDDGCRDVAESLDCVRQLVAAGFSGTVCTPHVAHDHLPDNTPERILDWTTQLRQTLRDEGVDYPLWAGGEVRLFRGTVDYLAAHGVPTLAGSRCVLLDTWDEKWHRWAFPTFEWLLARRYQPILAHPERIPGIEAADRHLRQLEAMGVWLQGNFKCMTGEEGYGADQSVRRLLTQGRYRLLAMDMHRPDTFRSRLDGLWLVDAEFGHDALRQLLADAPRRDVLQQSPASPS